MRTKKTRVGALLLLCMWLMWGGKSFAQLTTVDYDGAKYVLYEGKAALVQLLDSVSGELVIPEKLCVGETEYPVVAVGYNLRVRATNRPVYPLRGQKYLTSVVFPSSIVDGTWTVTSGSSRYTFNGMACASLGYCAGLTNVVLPEDVATLPSNMFAGCSSLEHLELPDAVTSFSGDFSGCTSLKSVRWSKNLATMGKFSECPDLETVYNTDGVQQIPDDAFTGCQKLDITLPPTVTSIGHLAFQGCTALKLTDIPATVTRIGNYAFDGCTELAIHGLPDALTYVGDYAFQNCAGVELQKLPSSLTYLGEYAFRYCSKVAVSEVPEGVTRIWGSFDGCNAITKMHLHRGVTYAWGLGGDQLANIEVDAENPYIKSIDGVLFNAAADTLMSCPQKHATSYTVPEGTTTLAMGSFWMCQQLKSLTLPSTLKNIGVNALSNSGIGYLHIPDQIEKIDNYAFMDSELKEISIPNNASLLGENGDSNPAFALLNQSLERITVRQGSGPLYTLDGVLCVHQADGREMLCYCPSGNGLMEYTVPDAIDSLAAGCFTLHQTLKKFTYGKNIKHVLLELNYCPALETLVMPNTIAEVNGPVCLECPALKTIVSYMETREQFYNMHRWVTFRGTDYTQVTVYAPDELVDMYRESRAWGTKDTDNYGLFDIRPLSEYTAGIDAPASDAVQPFTGAVYDLQGRKVSRPEKPGLYVTDGRKVLLK